MILSDAAIKNRTTVGVLVLLIVVAGSFSYVTLPREAAPDVPIPYINVMTTYEGVSPEDVETSVTMEIEEDLAGLKGVKEITSASAEGLSLITIEFYPNVLIEDALQYVRDRVDLAKPDLPADAEEPTISEINVAEFPIFMVNISGDISPVRLKAIADALEDAIEEIPGVLDVEVLGALEREIRLELDADRVAAYGLSVPEILTLIPSENVNISAGGLETPGTRFNVRLPAEFSDPEEVERLLLTVRDGRPIYLSDVARVRDTFKDRTSYSRLDGVDSINVSVKKRIGANIVEIADKVKMIVEEAGRRAPAGVSFQVTLDRSDDIRQMIRDLENNVFSGLVLVVAVLVLFMGLRTSMIVALVIPLSMLMSFALIQALGYTLNMIVLFSLILALGMLVDNAIVIVENIYRHLQLGYPRIEAAMKGTGEVAWPVITSTATTIAAFSPLLFWPGIVGDFMKYLPITVIIVLFSSLFVAMVVSPMVCSVLASSKTTKREWEASWFLRGYSRLLHASLSHKAVTLCLAVLFLAGSLILYVKFGEGVEFFPEVDPERAIIDIRCPQGTNIKETDRLARLAEQRVEAYRGDLKYVVSNVGSDEGGTSFRADAGGPHLANVTLLFQDYEVRSRPSAEAIAEVRQAVADIAGAEISVEKEAHGPPTGEAVTIRIMGEDFKVLEEISERAKRLIADVPGLINLRSDLEAARPELVFNVDRRRAMLLGVNSRVIGEYLKTLIFGREVGTYRQFNEEYDITIRLPLSQRSRIEDIFRLQVPNPAGEAVPLSSLGTFDYRGGFGTIHRVNQKRVVTLTGGVEGRLSNDVLNDIERRLSPLGDPRFTKQDIPDAPRLASMLVEAARLGSGPAARAAHWLRDDSEAWAVVEALAAGKGAEEDGIKDKLLPALNGLLEEEGFCQPTDFEGDDLSAQARQLVDRGPEKLSKEELRRLNRLLLEATFPGAITKAQVLDLAPGYAIRYAGEKEEQDKAFKFLILRALPLALLVIVMILVTQFNTLSAPLIIMTTVILSTIGVFLGLLVCGLPFGVIMTGIGVISLAGVVVNNAIVLLDYTRQLQKRGLGLIEAAVEAGTTRLRPVLLTATTTILGLVPMATGFSFDVHTFSLATRSESSEWWSSMAIAVIFGLAFATMLTLVVVPTLYVALYRLAERFGLGGLRRVEKSISRPTYEDF